MRDFQIYKQASIDSVPMKEHEEKVRQMAKAAEEQVVIRQNGTRRQNFPEKEVLSEQDLIDTMRRQTGRSPVGSRRGKAESGVSLGGNHGTGYFGSTGLERNGPTNRNLNVEWSSWDTSTGNGVDSLFGFESDEFDGPEW